MPQITTRFAPSPTGFLHIGGARTALFNYLFAKHNQGTYLVRIEDTDKARSTNEAKQAIIDGLQWLGLTGDKDIIYQSNNIQRHQQIAHQLVKDNKAYYCYCTPDELQQNRQQAIEKGEDFIGYNRKCRTLPTLPTLPTPNNPPAEPAAIRIKMPLNEKGESIPSIINDLVQGEVISPENTLDDFIILRQDGTPTYMLSVVVDDFDMNVTHIIRGDDHLMNAHRQKILFDSCGFPCPEFAHIPLIHGGDGKKLSKRHGALSVSEYKNMGYLAEAVNNHILKLGWSYGDDEFFTLAEATKIFDVKNINKGAAQFDFKKLDFFNNHYMQNLSDEKLLTHTKDFLGDDIKNDATIMGIVQKILPCIKSGYSTLESLAIATDIFIHAPTLPVQDDKANNLLQDNKDALIKIYDELLACENWHEENLKTLLQKIVEKHAIGKKIVMQMSRTCLVGTMSSSGSVTDILYALGKQESLKRIKSVADYLAI